MYVCMRIDACVCMWMHERFFSYWVFVSLRYSHSIISVSFTRVTFGVHNLRGFVKYRASPKSASFNSPLLFMRRLLSFKSLAYCVCAWKKYIFIKKDSLWCECVLKIRYNPTFYLLLAYLCMIKLLCKYCTAERSCSRIVFTSASEKGRAILSRIPPKSC